MWVKDEAKARAPITFLFSSGPVLFSLCLAPFVFSTALIFIEKDFASLIGDDNSV